MESVDEEKNKKPKGKGVGVNGNLIPRTAFPPGAQSKGAKTVNKMRAERKRAQELMQEILSRAINTQGLDLGELDEIAKESALDQGGKISVYQALLMAQAARAVLGDTTAATYCRDTAGDKPTDKQEITGTITEGDKALCAAVAARLDGGNNSTDSSADDHHEETK